MRFTLHAAWIAPCLLLALPFAPGCGSSPDGANGAGSDAGGSDGDSVTSAGGGADAASSDVGEACQREDTSCLDGANSATRGSCDAGDVCIPEKCGAFRTGFPGGYCSRVCDAATPCPKNAACIVFPQTGVQACARSCRVDDDCPGGGAFSCQRAAEGVDVCLPADPVPAGTNQGAACAGEAQMVAAGFGPSLAVPHPAGDVLDAEGNVAVDGASHVAVSFIGALDSGKSLGTPSTAGVATMGPGGFDPDPELFPTTLLGGFTVDPVVAFDRGVTPARLYATWLDVSPTAQASVVFVAHSDALGAAGTWSTPVAVTTPGAGALDKPWIAASRGHVIVSYTADASAEVIQVVSSDDGGETWAPPLDPGGGSEGAFAEVVMDDAANAWVGWFRKQAASYDLAVAALPAGAQAFSAPVVASGALVPDYVPPGFAVSPDGARLGAVFSDGKAATGGELWAAFSDDGGASFAPPVRVNDDASPLAPAPCATHFLGAMAIDAAGTAHVVFYDNRHLRGNLVYARSADGLSFGPNARVNDVDFFFTTNRGATAWLGDYVGLAVDGASLYAAWTDPRAAGLSRRYFASRPLP